MSEHEVAELARAIGGTGGHLCGYPWRLAWTEARRVINSVGISRALHDALREMQSSMNVHRSDKNAAVAIDRALFFETFTPLDPSCWAGDVLRRDLRAMSETAARRWRDLLLAGMEVDRAEPKPTHAAKLEKLADKVDDFDVRAHGWLDEVASLDEWVLSAAGADAVRALIWGRIPRPDPPRSALLRLASRPWKRARGWTPRHDRMVGGIAWALGVLQIPERVALLEQLQQRFGRTTARYAIQAALGAS